MITAPFNFVPLSEKVFFPDWAEQVSHDVPFEDAQSGVIDISITAKSPIFVRDHENSEQFCSHEGTYYIPGSSVKGMVRNVLEIMSFSKMSQINDDTYAVRDLRNRELYMSKMKPENTFCGWLKKTGNGYVIEDCGIPLRIHHKQIDYAYSIDFASKFHKTGFEKTSEYKYGLIGGSPRKITVSKPYKSATNPKYDKRLFCKYEKNGDEGVLVLTGQPTVRKDTGKMGDGKGFEFVFLEPKDLLKVDKKVFENFKFAYFDGRKTEPKESPDWIFWKEKLNNGEKVPVFFQKNGKEIAHLGLSYLYKLPYTHSVKDGLPPMHSDNRRDMAETIFGFIGKDEALKGRVQFSHFKAVDSVTTLKSRTVILGTPRASYYPIYVKQYDGKLFSTFMNGDFSISGWKRYPVHTGAKVSSTTDTGNENVGTTFSPLKEGIVFKGKMRYHNLKKAELGALLSSLTFHNTAGCFHNIGLAKALGYGKIELKLNGIANIEEYLKAFEVEVSEQVENWSNSMQLSELLSMATEQNNRGNSKLKYMDLPQFSKNKTGDDKDYLRNYTLLEGIVQVLPQTLISQNDIDNLKIRQEKRKIEEQLRQEKKKKDDEHKKEWEIVYESTNLSTIEAFIKKYPDTPYLETAKQKIADLAQAVKDEEKKKKEIIALEKWKAVQKVEEKYKQKALEDFIVNYSYSNLVEDAKKELGTIVKGNNEGNKNQVISIENIRSEDELYLYLKSRKNTLDNEIDDIKKIANEFFSKLESKKQKNNMIKRIDKSTYKNFSKKLGL